MATMLTEEGNRRFCFHQRVPEKPRPVICEDWHCIHTWKAIASFHYEGKFGSIKLVSPHHFLLNCLNQARKERVVGYSCVRGIDCVQWQIYYKTNEA